MWRTVAFRLDFAILVTQVTPIGAVILHEEPEKFAGDQVDIMEMKRTQTL